MTRHRHFIPVCRVLLLWLIMAAPMAQAAGLPPAYQISKTVLLGGEAKWDEIAYDPVTRSVFVAHGNELTVINPDIGTVTQRLPLSQNSHGLALAPEMKLGFVDSENPPTLTVFQLDNLRVVASLPLQPHPGALVYDSPSHQLYILHGPDGKMTVIDPVTNQTVSTLSLGDKTDSLVSDDQGSIFLSLNTRREILRLDTVNKLFPARLRLPECDNPHGLTMDRAERRIFANCANNRTQINDAETGRAIMSLPVGKAAGGLGYNAARRLLFSANGDGTLSVIAVFGSDQYRAVTPIITGVGARTLAVDEENDRLFLVTATLEHSDPGPTPTAPPQNVYVPGTARLLILTPVP